MEIKEPTMNDYLINLLASSPSLFSYFKVAEAIGVIAVIFLLLNWYANAKHKS
jgi:hypothetical protein